VHGIQDGAEEHEDGKLKADAHGNSMWNACKNTTKDRVEHATLKSDLCYPITFITHLK